LNYLLSRFVVEEVNLRTLKQNAQCKARAKSEERRAKGRATRERRAERIEKEEKAVRLEGRGML